MNVRFFSHITLFFVLSFTALSPVSLVAVNPGEEGANEVDRSIPTSSNAREAEANGPNEAGRSIPTSSNAREAEVNGSNEDDSILAGSPSRVSTSSESEEEVVSVWGAFNRIINMGQLIGITLFIKTLVEGDPALRWHLTNLNKNDDALKENQEKIHALLEQETVEAHQRNIEEELQRLGSVRRDLKAQHAKHQEALIRRLFQVADDMENGRYAF